MIESMENFTNYLGANRYQAQSMCLTSDYVLVKMYTLLYGLVGVSTIFLAIVCFFTYRNSNHMLRVAIVLLKDPWILKLISILFFAQGAYALSSVSTVHFAVYYSDLLILAGLTGTTIYTVWRVLTIVFDQDRQETILDELIPGGVPDYDFKPCVNGGATVHLPVTHHNNPKVKPRPKNNTPNRTGS